jgi:CheY-like chemotaxis protein
MKVLVVHWQVEVADHIKEQLPQCSVVCESTGWKGLVAACSSRFDLVISGFNLPVVTGYEMVRAIRLQSINKKVPVILLAEGRESPAHHRLAQRLDAAVLKLSEIEKMKDMELWLS